MSGGRAGRFGDLGTKIGVVVVTLLLGLYLWLTLRQSWLLITGGDVVGRAIGVALVVLPVIAAVFVGREIVFGLQAQHLLRRMSTERSLPVDDLPKRPSGRADRAAADAAFPRWKAEVEASPGDWRAWYRLGLAYRASGDTRRARASVRRAIELERGDRG